MINSKSKIFVSIVFVLLVFLTSIPPVEAKTNVLKVPGTIPPFRRQLTLQTLEIQSSLMKGYI